MLDKKDKEINPSDSALLKRVKELEKQIKRLVGIIDNMKIKIDMLNMEIDRIRREQRLKEHPKFPEPYVPPNYPTPDWRINKVTITSNKK